MPSGKAAPNNRSAGPTIARPHFPHLLSFRGITNFAAMIISLCSLCSFAAVS